MAATEFAYMRKLSDSEMIDCYITCSCCGEKQVNEQQSRIAIERANNAEEFFEICDAFAAPHSPEQKEQQNA
jgi:hypothetical protein